MRAACRLVPTDCHATPDFKAAVEDAPPSPAAVPALVAGDAVVDNPKAKVAVVALGSRGDFQPYVALCIELRRAGYHVRCYGFKNHVAQARQYGLEILPFDYDLELEFQTDPRLREAMATGDFAKFLRCACSIPWMRFGPIVDDLEAFRPDLLLGGALSRIFSVGVAEKLGIPAMWVDLQPCAASAQYPCMVAEQLSLGGCCAAPMHRLMVRMIHSTWTEPGFPEMVFREQKLGLPAGWTAEATDALMACFCEPPWPLLVCVSPTLFPRPRDWPSAVQVVGPLIVPVDETMRRRPPQLELVKFLEAGSAPIYIGWGSMICRSAEHMTELAVRSLYETGERGIVLSGWAQLSPELLDTSRPDYAALYHYARTRVLFGNDLPHEWLFPRVKLTVHHGGSGTTHCALRAGRPTIITPVFTDQFSYRRLAVRLGVCVSADRLHSLTPSALAGAIRKASTVPMMARAKEVGDAMRAENGAVSAVKRIETYLRDKVRTGDWKEEFEERFVSKLRRPV